MKRYLKVMALVALVCAVSNLAQAQDVQIIINTVDADTGEPSLRDTVGQWSAAAEHEIGVAEVSTSGGEGGGVVSFKFPTSVLPWGFTLHLDSTGGMACGGTLFSERDYQIVDDRIYATVRIRCE